ncbi:MAG: hypothetical protein LUG12_06720 [Erysipelotrichaceae bacterium]|nr:hypothetical protein [Erysipelotrichaceae bacterium]
MEKLSINSYLKKFFIVFLACFMMISLVGCSDGDDTTSDDSSSDTTEKITDNEITFTELTVVDNDECSIVINGIDEDGFWGYTLTAELENKSEDVTYMFSVESASVNGVMSDPLFASEVAAGKKSNEEISFISDTTLEENGIDEFTDIELTFRVYNSDDWEEDAVANETVHVYPYGEDKATTFIRESQDSDNVLVDNDDVTVIVIGYDPDDTWGYGVNLYLVNKTDTEVMFSLDDASINGYMIDPFYATAVSAGKSAFSTISWYDSDLEENAIEDIEEIEFKLSAYNNDDWLDDYYVDGQTVTLNP